MQRNAKKLLTLLLTALLIGAGIWAWAKHKAQADLEDRLGRLAVPFTIHYFDYWHSTPTNSTPQAVNLTLSPASSQKILQALAASDPTPYTRRVRFTFDLDPDQPVKLFLTDDNRFIFNGLDVGNELPPTYQCRQNLAMVIWACIVADHPKAPHPGGP